MRRRDHLEEFTRFRCDTCGKIVDRKGDDDGSQRPPDSWRFIEVDRFRAHLAAPLEERHIVGLVCSPPCAATLAATSWTAAP